MWFNLYECTCEFGGNIIKVKMQIFSDNTFW